MKCPVCNIPLQMTERQGIEIDYCSQCRGVWLDRGELDKLIERSTQRDVAGWGDMPRSTDERSRYEDYQQQRKYKSKYKKKSIWRELFDFD